jgi:hypothetical protein
MRSDGSERNVKQRCKDVCIPGTSEDNGGHVIAFQSCVFGDAPWIDADIGQPYCAVQTKRSKVSTFLIHHEA